jgi:EmrB/QacA subfamily drug resistance transporter
MFLIGLVVFTSASLLAALAWNEPSLIGARAIQGLGAAIIAPAALSMLMTTFAEGKERNIALGVWGAVGGFGAAAGVLLGGIFTDLLSWEWIFFLNIPVGLSALALTPVLLAESRDVRTKGFDALGAVLVTAGLSAAVFGITQANDWGWSSSRTIGVFATAAALLLGFVVRETVAEHPLMSFSIFRIKTVAGANIAGFILGTALFSMFLMLTLYMQQVLGYSPLKTGVAYIAVAGGVIVWSMVAQQLVTRVGVKPVLVAGMSLLTVGLVYFTQVSVDGSYLGDLLPGFLIIAMGMGFSFVPISIAALAGIQAKDAGLASGLINTSQQIGGALGIAVLSAVAVATRPTPRRRGRGAAGADLRLPGGVLGRRSRRSGRRGRLARAHPQGRARIRPGRRAGGGRRARRSGLRSSRRGRRARFRQALRRHDGADWVGPGPGTVPPMAKKRWSDLSPRAGRDRDPRDCKNWS